MRLGIRGKLITIFIFIKVIPLILLAWLAKNAVNQKFMSDALEVTAKKLSLSTLFMIILVIFIAIWMASTLPGK
ncbi:MAG: hypothetical protein E4H46_02240 [Desulfobacterales bacterium]|nr:MAG: hypothetical protein E4H46_02240 [Desulfobacterales bacterium]